MMSRARWLLLVCAACSGSPPAPDAGEVDAGPARDAGISELLAAHNAVRARAMPAPMPALPPLSWSDAAANEAAAWVEQCKWGHNPAIDNTYGENIYGSTTASVSATAVVEDWAAEAPDYDYANNTCASVCGHYTQLVWRATTSVGCAWKVCTTGSPFPVSDPRWLYFVCDYVPPGNVVGRRPY